MGKGPSDAVRGKDVQGESPQEMLQRSAHSGLAPEPLISPWIIPGHEPPASTDPKVKEDAAKVKRTAQPGPRPAGKPSCKPVSSGNPAPGFRRLRVVESTNSDFSSSGSASSLRAGKGPTPPREVPFRAGLSPTRVPWNRVRNHFGSLEIHDKPVSSADEKLFVPPHPNPDNFPGPEKLADATHDVHRKAVDPTVHAASAAMRDGIWQTDQSRHARVGQKVIEGDPKKGTILVPTPDGGSTLRVAYFFSGTKRKASIGECLADLCQAAGIGLVMHEVDTLVGGKDHNLLDKQAQDEWIGRILDGEFDLCIHSPPCASWSRAPWSDDKPPQPVRNKLHPWGIPWLLKDEQQKAKDGNEFIHFTLRSIAAAKEANDRGYRVRSLWEHPEDLGRTHRGVPASAWQLPETRKAFAGRPHTSVAGHQCQFDHDGAPYDCKKPTRFLTDILTFKDFGYPGWPSFDGGDNYTGPLPRSCGHVHKKATIGRNAEGGFNTSPLAAYPSGMCRFIARHCFENFLQGLRAQRAPGGLGRLSSKKARSSLSFGDFVWSAPTTSTDTTTPSTSSTGPSSRPERFNSLNVDQSNKQKKECRWLPTNVSQEEVEAATQHAEDRGIHAPIKDGLDTPLDSRKRLDPADWPTSEDESELPGVKRPPKGSGWWGNRSPLRATKKGIERPFTDGAGLASPGRWAKDRRNLPHNKVADEIRRVFERGLRRAEQHLPGGKFKTGLFAMAAGKVDACPFPPELLEETRADLRVLLMEYGYGDGLPQQGDVDQLPEVRLIQGLLAAFKDPDAYFCEWWARGAWLGSAKRRLPRARHLYDRKVRWALPTSAEELHGEWQVNYSSLREHQEQVHNQFLEEEKEGLMCRMSLGEALDKYGPDLLITATGAIAKKGGTGDIRVIFDGSHGVLVNFEIIVRDQVRFPTSDDIKVVMREMHREQHPCFSLLFDVSKAHRRVPIVQSDWCRQACQVRGSAAEAARRKRRTAGDREFKNRVRGLPPTRGSAAREPLTRADFTPEELAQDLWLNKVGTFGVSSAGYWWGRAGGALIRLTHYVNGLKHALWCLLYSDDGWSTGQGERADEALLLQLLLLAVLKIPLAWHKLRGGTECEWVGYWMDMARFRLGVSAARAAWAVRWLDEKATEGRARLGELREGLGRLGFIAGPMDHLRPFLGPIYAWCAAGPRYAQPRLPVMVVLVLRYLARELREDHATDYRQHIKNVGEVFRLDAAAKGNAVSIGGWRVGPNGDTKQAAWFAEQLTRAEAPWAFERGEPFRTIASLELLGVLVGVMTLTDEAVPGHESIGVVSISCGTDNQGNTFLVDKLLTTKFPLVVILMELSHQLRKRRLVLRADWLPRLQNQEADDLTNAEFHAFDPQRRIRVELDRLPFAVLPELFAEGNAYVEALEAQREAERARKASVASGQSRDEGRKRPRDEPLRVTDPWP